MSTVQPKREKPPDLVRTDQFSYWFTDSLGNTMDSLFDFRLPWFLGGMVSFRSSFMLKTNQRYHLGLGAVIDAVPMAGPPTQAAVISGIFLLLTRWTGAPMSIFERNETLLLALTPVA